jgi:hypothetical protein
MNSPSKRFVFEPAGPEDEREILDIFEASVFSGKISLLYTRRPNVYESFLKEGEDVELLLCRDREKGRVVGLGAYSVSERYVNGRAQKVGYIFSLRGRGQSLKSHPLLPKAFEYLERRCRNKGVDFYLTTILSDNVYARQLLEKRRRCMPFYEFYGNYEVFALRTSLGLKPQEDIDLVFRKAQKIDVDAVVEFLNKEGRRYQFFPVIRREDLIREVYPAVAIENFYLVVDRHGRILAAGAAWDQHEYKQYIMQGAQGTIGMNNLFASLCPSFLWPWPKFPMSGEMLRFFTLSFWVIREHNKRVFNYFLARLSVESSQYPFFLVGVYGCHPLRRCLTSRPHVVYKSRAYLVNWDKKTSPLTRLNEKFIPYLECGML